ncbi:MAG: DUF4271 domain-containing protein [Saprospiraceae bacterium]|nr:DUF4271 domain-containing protein [Saprospiraceae bacterium]
MKIKSGLILFIISYLMAGQICIAQNTNPFDIKSRLNSKVLKKNNDSLVAKDTTISQITSYNDSFALNTSNPFDIDRNKIDSLSEYHSGQSESVSYRIPVDTKSLKKAFSGNSSNFLLWVFMFILIIVAILTGMNREVVIKIIESSWFNNLMNLLHRNFGNKDVLLYSLLYVSFAMNIAIFFYLLIGNKFNYNGFLLFIYLLLTVVFIYVIKHLAIVLFERVFPSLKGIRIYNFSIMIFNIILGIALIPVNAFAAFSTPVLASVFISTGLVLIAIFYVFRLLRGLLSTYNYFVISIFHFFIYLCAFEILPLLIIYKLVLNF